MNDKLKILIVDDEDSLRLSLASILELEGYEVKTAENGYKAIELAKQEDFDIIFSDIRMPGMTGDETFKEIKKIKPDIIGVMMTAYALNDLIVNALNSGAFACISKPFEINTILSTIKDITTRPFAVVIDNGAKINVQFLNSLKNCGLNVANCAIDKIGFMSKHRPDILIIGTNTDNEQTLSDLKKLKETLPEIPDSILVTGKENTALIEEAKKIGITNFLNLPLNVSQIFKILGKEKRKPTVGMVNMNSQEFEELHQKLTESGFHIISYSNSQKLIHELKESFFDAILIDVKIETNIFDVQEKIKKDFPNIGTVYILNDDKELEALKQKGYFYITKPFEMEEVIKLINKITGK